MVSRTNARTVPLLAWLSLGASGCAPSPSRAAPRTPEAPRADVLAAEPVDAHVLPAEDAAPDGCKPELDALFAPYALPGVPGAAVVIAQAGTILCERAYGLADLATGERVTPRTSFRLSSMTKAMTAMAVLILVDRGHLQLDQSLASVFGPSFPSWGRAVTVRHLLHHQAGLLDYTCPAGRSDADPMTDAEVLAQVRASSGPRFRPGTRFAYSNTGYSVLASIVEAVARRPFASFLQTELFTPLGMTDAQVVDPHAPPALTVMASRARGYERRRGTPAFALYDQQCDTGVLGDGNAYASARDMVRWEASLAPEAPSRRVRAELVAEMFRPASPGQEPAYGFGWFLGRFQGLEVNHHGGATGGFESRIERYPSRRFTVIVLTNRSDGPGVTDGVDLEEQLVNPILALYLTGS